jgi:hypothetical protein
MSIAIQYPVNGGLIPFERSRSAAVTDRADKGAGFRLPAKAGAWLRALVGPRRSVNAGRAPDPRRKRADPDRERRSVFHSWAADDLAHRDVALQLWPAARLR